MNSTAFGPIEVPGVFIRRMPDTNPKSMRPLAWAALSFTALCAIVIALTVLGAVSFQLGLLMLVGLVALYFGIGVLVVVYRFVGRLN